MAGWSEEIATVSYCTRGQDIGKGHLFCEIPVTVKLP